MSTCQREHTFIAGVLSCSLLVTVFSARAQYNLVPNFSFEQYTKCPIPTDTRGNKPDNWYKPDNRGAGYYNACAGSGPTVVCGVPSHATAGGSGFQYARTGNAYVGMFYYNGGDSRNYFQVQLLDSLRQDKCYYVECHVNLGDEFRFSCNNQAILLTSQAIYADTIHAVQLISATPQIINYGNPNITDTLNWVKVSGIFTAQGGEQFLTLGNFKPNNQTTYQVFNPAGGYNGAAYYVDDVSVIPLDSMPLKANAGTDTTIAQGDTIFIGTLTNGITNIHWYNAAGQAIDSTRPGFNVTPDSTTFYIVEQTVCGYTSRDTVTITVNPLPLHWFTFTATTLSNEAVALNWQTANEQNVSHINIQRSTRGTQDFQTIATLPATNKPHNQYSYLDHSPFTIHHSLLYRLQSIDNDGRRSYSEIRRVSLNTSHTTLNTYPNPTKETLNIQLTTRNEKQVTVLITDIAGRLVQQQAIQLTAGDNTKAINVSSLQSGSYLIKVVCPNGCEATVSKFMKN